MCLDVLKNNIEKWKNRWGRTGYKLLIIDDWYMEFIILFSVLHLCQKFLTKPPPPPIYGCLILSVSL